MDEIRLKALLKETVEEVFEEKREYFIDIIEDVLDDIILTKEIKEGLLTEEVSKEEVFGELTKSESES